MVLVSRALLGFYFPLSERGVGASFTIQTEHYGATQHDEDPELPKTDHVFDCYA